jgi:hypothetical protein
VSLRIGHQLNTLEHLSLGVGTLVEIISDRGHKLEDNSANVSFMAWF